MTTIDDAILVAFVDGELSPSETQRVQEFVARNPAAQEKIRLMRLSAQLVRQIYRDPAYETVPPAALRMVEDDARPGERGQGSVARGAWP
jgi:anti-sigma factor RsiW